MGKLIGIDFEGQEDEVLKKIIKLKQLDAERVEQRKKSKSREVKRRRIKKIIKDNKVDMVLLQETKRAAFDSNLVRSIWPEDNLEFMEVGASGSAGGLVCVWNPAMFALVDCCCSRNFILLAGKIMPYFDCVVINVYAPNEVTKRRDLWDLIARIKPLFPNPWCIGGDFNKIRHLGEMVGSSRRNVGMNDFNVFIDRMKGVELPLLRRKFTWSDCREEGRWNRIDRFIVDSDWLLRFDYKCWGLPRILSDHCPLLLTEDIRD
ncbi:uncharacterized protein LOC114307162 [Camellia sinensis]|uniref:uncharacterized protein LOC114307162 n=1 Tax=Camellia sinensis TaxID=4442 RepID=UPI0010358EBE|nr:uncharacterized protein LOC114307162 [Camellia sinensis]